MTHLARPPRVSLRVEQLEDRFAPSAGFDAGSLPTSWSQWSNLGVDSFHVTAPPANAGLGTVTTDGPSNLAARAWQLAAVDADAGASAQVALTSLQPVQVFVRGSNLDTAAPSYYAASVTRGLEVQLVRVQDGVATVLATVSSRNYVSGPWVRLTLLPEGNRLTVQVYRIDTQEYLTADGTWQATPASVLDVTDDALPASGQVGIGRPALYSGPVSVDAFTVLAPSETCSGSTSTLPPHWAQWSSNGQPVFSKDPTATGPTPGLIATATSSQVAARAWLATPAYTDIELAASVYLGSLNPAQLIARGSGLDTSTPSYYAVSVTRGTEIDLLRVVNGVSTALGSVSSAGYFSGQWVRVTLTVQGNQLRVGIRRADTGQYLNGSGQWQSAAAWALSVSDGALPGPGLVGLARPAQYAGTVLFSDVAVTGAVSVTPGPTVVLTVPDTSRPWAGAVNVVANVTAPAGVDRVEFAVDGQVLARLTAAPYAWPFDTRQVADGTHTLTVTAYDAAGNSGRATLTVAVVNQPLDNTVPNIPQHYDHIRLAELAYYGTPLDSFAQNLLRNSVDLVVPAANSLPTIHSVAPTTPQVIYSNVSNLYQDLLTDWLQYADAHGLNREDAFYHVTQATPFDGNSPSSQPVNWFWSVLRNSAGGTTYTDLTSAARARAGSTQVALAGAGGAVYVGYTDRFGELNVTLSSGASGGWSGVLEYASAVDAAGHPTAWRSLSILSDGTNGWQRSGRIAFDPPADWKAATLATGARLLYVRVRTTSAGGTAPVASLILGRDYVGANGGTSGTIPAYDYSADVGNKGYLTAAEYAHRRPGFDAKFAYEGRFFYPAYGQMRFATNPAPASVQAWAGDYAVRTLAAQPLADGLFLDNSIGRSPARGYSVRESTTTYADDLGALLAAVDRAIAPKWVLANTAGGYVESDAVVAQAPVSMEEFALRAMSSSTTQFEDLANLVARRQAQTPTHDLILDSLPTGGSPTDGRTQLATLAEYYLLADPRTTFLMLFGGYAPASSWTQHWTPAAAVDIGQPLDTWSVRASGSDPANFALTYKVYQRPYGNGLVLYKPESYALGRGTGTTADNTATWVDLGGSYRPVNADGTLGAVVTRIQMRNGEGAVLIKA